MPANTFDFRYTPADIASAQRVRFLRSRQFKLIILLFLGTLAFTAGPLILPGVFPALPYSSWGLVGEVILVYVVTLGVLALALPFAEYYLNRFWRTPLSLQFNNKQMRLFVTGKTGGLSLKWGEIVRAEETDRTFILFYGPGGKYLILPKSAFAGDPASLQRFTERVTHATGLPPAGPSGAPQSSEITEPEDLDNPPADSSE